MYATLAQMVARFEAPDDPELTQLTGGGSGLIDEVRVATALAEASGQMDLYIGTRNALPLSGLAAAHAEELARLACDIARYRLWSDAASEEVRRRYEDAIRILEQIAKGTLVLAFEGGTTSPAVGSVELAAPMPSVFGRGPTGGLL